MLWRLIKFGLLFLVVDIAAHARQQQHGMETHTAHINGEHISVGFYMVVAKTDRAKNALQQKLHNFVEILQRNMTTSSIFNALELNATDNVETVRQQLRKLDDLSAYFQDATEIASTFAREAETFFEASKNESHRLLYKLRQVPTQHRVLTMEQKLQLTDYFTEMEFFHVMFTEIVDEALEYIDNTLFAMRRTFMRYADIQRDVLRGWNAKLTSDAWCRNRYMDFLQQWSSQIFQCAAGTELLTAYDVYAMTEVNAKYVLRQLEFRVQRLFNCFLFGGLRLRCRFLRHAEQDFEKLFTKLDELQTYFDIKITHGKVPIDRDRRKRQTMVQNLRLIFNNLKENTGNDIEEEEEEEEDKCIPYGFPYTQMLSGLKTCFN